MVERIYEKDNKIAENSEEIYKEIEALLKYTDKNVNSQGAKDSKLATNEEREDNRETEDHIIAAEQYLISLYSCTSEESNVKLDENGLIA